jgi:hypothetical protein
MRSVLILVYSAFLMISTGAFPQKTNQETPPYKPPAVVSAMEAVYPITSVASGTVMLRAALDDGGAITCVRVLRGGPYFTEKAASALREWNREPARLNNHPIALEVPVGFGFVPPQFWPSSLGFHGCFDGSATNEERRNAKQDEKI